MSGLELPEPLLEVWSKDVADPEACLLYTSGCVTLGSEYLHLVVDLFVRVIVLPDGIWLIDNQQGIRHIVQLFSIGVLTDLDSWFLCLNLYCVSRVDDLEFGKMCIRDSFRTFHQLAKRQLLTVFQ